jgi:hypothetical protein
MYVKVFEKSVSKPDYPATEAARIRKMTESSGVSKEKKVGWGGGAGGDH